MVHKNPRREENRRLAHENQKTAQRDSTVERG